MKADSASGKIFGVLQQDPDEWLGYHHGAESDIDTQKIESLLQEQQKARAAIVPAPMKSAICLQIWELSLKIRPMAEMEKSLNIKLCDNIRFEIIQMHRRNMNGHCFCAQY